MEMDYNSPEKLEKWAAHAVEKVPDPWLRIRLRAAAGRIFSCGGLRGNVSEHWRDNYPEAMKYLQDLYL